MVDITQIIRLRRGHSKKKHVMNLSWTIMSKQFSVDRSGQVTLRLTLTTWHPHAGTSQRVCRNKSTVPKRCQRDQFGCGMCHHTFMVFQNKCHKQFQNIIIQLSLYLSLSLYSSPSHNSTETRNWIIETNGHEQAWCLMLVSRLTNSNPMILVPPS